MEDITQNLYGELHFQGLDTSFTDRQSFMSLPWIEDSLYVQRWKIFAVLLQNENNLID